VIEVQQRIPAVIMRGGTSKGIFLKREDIPFFHDQERRDRMLLSIFGSPDPMQIDGLGGTHSHTSKVMIAARSKRPDFDIEYTFGQVAVDKPLIDYSGNCGNLTSAIGPYAIDERMVVPREPITTLTLYNTNTKKTIIAEVPVSGNQAQVEGDYAIAGVPGTGAKILLHFVDPAGSITGSLLPTGSPVDKIDTSEEIIACSIVDAATLNLFVRAEDLDLSGLELPQDVNSNELILAKIERIRGMGAEMLGLANTPGEPKVVMVSRRRSYTSALGTQVSAEEIDLVARLISMQKMHHAYAVTSALCTATAAKIKGTIVNEVAGSSGEPGKVFIGHPKGSIEVAVKASYGGAQLKVDRLTIGRTARRLMDGYAYHRLKE